MRYSLFINGIVLPLWFVLLHGVIMQSDFEILQFFWLYIGTMGLQIFVLFWLWKSNDLRYRPLTTTHWSLQLIFGLSTLVILNWISIGDDRYYGYYASWFIVFLLIDSFFVIYYMLIFWSISRLPIYFAFIFVPLFGSSVLAMLSFMHINVLFLLSPFYLLASVLQLWAAELGDNHVYQAMASLEEPESEALFPISAENRSLQFERMPIYWPWTFKVLDIVGQRDHLPLGQLPGNNPINENTSSSFLSEENESLSVQPVLNYQTHTTDLTFSQIFRVDSNGDNQKYALITQIISWFLEKTAPKDIRFYLRTNRASQRYFRDYLSSDSPSSSLLHSISD